VGPIHIATTCVKEKKDGISL